MKKLLVLLCVVGLANAQMGCAQRAAFGGCDFRLHTAECHRPLVNPTKVRDADLSAAVSAAADALLADLPPRFQRTQLVSTSLADLNDLQRTSPLGRLVGEQLAVRFAQRGFHVREVKFRHALKVAENGEFMLSREIQRIGREHSAQGISVGTYAVAEDKVYFTMKLVDLGGLVHAAHGFSLPLGPNLQALSREPDRD